VVSWREFLSRLYKELSDDDAMGQAAQFAYWALLALFPFLISLLSFVAYLPVPHLSERLLALMAEVVPPEGMILVRKIVLPIVEKQRGGLLTLGLLGSLWSASSAFSTFVSVINRTLHLQETRPWLKRQVLAMVMTVGLSAFIMAAMVLLVMGPQLAQALAYLVGLGETFKAAWGILQWPAVFALVVLALSILYRFAPSEPRKWCCLAPGAIVASILWVAVSYGFAYYVRHFGAYNKVYGGIGAVVVLMLWLYLSGLSVIIGAEVNAQLGARQGEAAPEHP
jgi:membrane protein